MKRIEQHIQAKLAIALSFLLVMNWASFVYPQMAVSPIIVDTQAYPGGIRTFQVSISNNGTSTMVVEHQISAMTVLAGGMPVEVEEAPRSCKDWMSVDPGNFVLPPKSNQAITCRVRVPKDAGGGYYAILSFHGTPQSGTGDTDANEGVGAGIKLTHRSLIPVLLKVPASEVRAIIDTAPPIITKVKSGLGYFLDMPVRNRGNIHYRMSGAVEIRSDSGLLLEKFELSAGRGFILPQHERLFKSKLKLSLPDGIYLARTRLISESGAPMQNEYPFFIENSEPIVAQWNKQLKEKLIRKSAGFIVKPSQLLSVVRAGGTRTQAVELVNLSNQTISLKIKPMQWYRAPDGRDMVIEETPQHGRSGRDWVSARQKEIQLRPLSRQRIPLTITLPKNAVGEFYAAMTFDRTDIELDDSPLEIARRSAMLGLMAQGTGESKAKVTDFQVSRLPNGITQFTVQVTNIGTLSIDPELTVTVTDSDGNYVKKLSPENKISGVQAGCDCVLYINWPRILTDGDYSAQITVRYAPNVSPLTGRVMFSVGDTEKSGTTAEGSQPSNSTSTESTDKEIEQ